MNMLTTGMQQMNMAAPGVNGNNMGNNMGSNMGSNMGNSMGNNMGNSMGSNVYPSQSFSGYSSPPYNSQSNQQPRDSQARVIQNRRQMDNEGEQSSLSLMFF